MNYCNQCGKSLSFIIPPDDDRHRHVCNSCNHIHYENPRIIVCALPTYEDSILLCKRAIEPRLGLWTLPGGFMENDETTQQAAARETWEEAGAKVKIGPIYTLFSLPHINQVHIFYLATLSTPEFEAGQESLEVKLVNEHNMPWNELAFLPVKQTLEHYLSDRQNDSFPMRVADITLGANSERIITPHP